MPACGPLLVGRGGVEPPTYRVSVDRSYQLSYLPKQGETLPEDPGAAESVVPSTGHYACRAAQGVAPGQRAPFV